MTITNLLTSEFATIPENTKSNEETSKSDQKVAQIWIEQGPLSTIHHYIINPICDFFSLSLKGQDVAAKEKAIQFDKMNTSSFPAIVDKPKLVPSDPSYELSKIYPDLSSELYELLGFLGYSCSIVDDTFHLYLPSVETLNTRWEEYRELHKDQMLPPLKFISSKGIESHEGFIYAFFTADAIISDDIEAVHDHGSHVIMLLANVLLYKEKYPVIREKMRDLIRQAGEEPLQLAKEAGLKLPYDELKAVEGAIVDTLLAASTEIINRAFEEMSFEDLWANTFIHGVEEGFLEQDVENRWITYLQTQFADNDPETICHAWMVVQSRAILHKAHLLSDTNIEILESYPDRANLSIMMLELLKEGLLTQQNFELLCQYDTKNISDPSMVAQSICVLHKAHLLTDANIKTLESYPDTENLSKAMLELLKEGLLTQQNFELLCQVAPEDLQILRFALVNLKKCVRLPRHEFAVLLRNAASLGFIDIVDALLSSPLAFDLSNYQDKREALVIALDHCQLTCALRLLDDKRHIPYLDSDESESLLKAASDPSMNDLFLKSEFSKSLSTEFINELKEAAEESGNFEFFEILKTRLQKTAL